LDIRIEKDIEGDWRRKNHLGGYTRGLGADRVNGTPTPPLSEDNQLTILFAFMTLRVYQERDKDLSIGERGRNNELLRIGVTNGIV
jgi:hypothetical protein